MTGLKVIVDWDYFADCVNLCANQLESLPQKITHVAGISRGGLLPGVMLSHKLDLPFIPLMWSTRDHVMEDHRAVLDIVRILSNDSEACVLIVDDICDTGKSFDGLISAISEHQVKDAKSRTVSAAVFGKEDRQFQPDIVGKEVGNHVGWLVFPFENQGE